MTTNQERSEAGLAMLSRIGPGQDFVTLNRYQDRSQGKICQVARLCYVDRVPGLLQGLDLLGYMDVAGACLVAKNASFAA